MKYDTFICWRGETTDGGISLKIGKQIDRLIRDDKRYGNVFFAPRMPNYNFIKDAKRIIKDVSLMIVVFCPNFFQGFDNLEESSAYHELLAAFNNPNCVFFPVYTYAFKWSDENKEFMNNLYGKECARRLYHMTGKTITGDVITAEDLSTIFSIEESKKEETQAQYDLELYRDEEGQCGTTIFDTAITFCGEDCVTDTYMLRRNPSKYFLPSMFLKTGDEYCDLCTIDETDFVYWPVDISSNEEKKEKKFSICAICFGISILYNYLKTQEGEWVEQIKSMVNGAIRTLIVLRSPEEKTWPSIWDFEEKNMVEGTINQTTLSVSTLLSCGFLGVEDSKTFKERYNFILESIRPLSENKVTRRIVSGMFSGKTSVSWGYMFGSKTSAFLPTAFAFDTLLKFRQNILTRINEFEEDSDFTQSMKEHVEEIDAVLKGVIRYFKEKQRADGGFQIQNKFSITHTSKIIKSLTLYLLAYEEQDEYYAVAEGMVQKGLKLLYELDIERIFNLEAHEKLEKFSYSNGDRPEETSDMLRNQGEEYEHCSELLYLAALLKAAELYQDQKENYLKKTDEVLSKFRKLYVQDEDLFFVKGKRKELKYPIYALYNYRLVVADFLKLAEGE